ncbi:MAG: hypothetical protein H0T13_00715 [Actinobacteria bacterium]|nr:hypothetical protein [Actinomycetota bacterium]
MEDALPAAPSSSIPFDVLDAARKGLAQDPTGAYFALWEAGTAARSSPTTRGR